MRPLRIEMVLPTLAPAGMEVMTARLTRALAQRGHDIGITCLEEGGTLADELRADGFHVSIVPAPGLRSNLRAPALEHWLARQERDVVHIHSGVWLKAARAAKRAKVPRVVHTAHGLLDHEPWFGVVQKRWAARHTDWIAAVSEPLRQYLVERVRLNPRKVTAIPNGADTDRFAPGPRSGVLRAALSLPNDALVVGNVAGLKPVKDHRLLIDAFALMHAELPASHLVIVGDGSLRAELEAHVQALALTDVVHLVGQIADPAPVYRDLDLFVLSSRAEGTSMSILESMASGVPVIATAVGGTPDILAPGRSGMLVPARDHRALASAMLALLRDPDARRRLSSAGRRRVVDGYSEHGMVCSYEALYTAEGSAMPSHEPAVSQCVG